MSTIFEKIAAEHAGEPGVHRLHIVNATYQTESGNIGHARYEIYALTSEDAFDEAKRRIVGDKRRKYLGKLDMSCS